MGKVLVELDESIEVELLPLLDEENLLEAINELENDDAAYLLGEIAPDVRGRVLNRLNKDKSAEIRKVLAYPNDTAGSLMQSISISLGEKQSARDVLQKLRRYGPLSSNITTLYVVNNRNILQGEISIHDLLSLAAEESISEIIKSDLVSIKAQTDQEEVGMLFRKYDLISAPVVDQNAKLIGRITVDDVIEVVEEEVEEDMLRLGGIESGEDLFGSALKISLRRSVWLGFNLVTAFLSSFVIQQFDATISEVIALAVLMPIVASMGGNVGSQTLTAVVRALALGQINPQNSFKLLYKQATVGLISGVLWASVVAIIVYLWFGNPILGGVIFSAMIINLLSAGLLGAFIPITLEKLKIDPALAAGVILTASTDIIGFLSFLGLATLYLT